MSPDHCTPHSLTHSPTHPPTQIGGVHPTGSVKKLVSEVIRTGTATPLEHCLKGTHSWALALRPPYPRSLSRKHAHGVSTTIALAHRHLTRAHIGHTLCSPALLAEPHKRELPKRVCLCSWHSLSSPDETSTHRSRAGQEQNSPQHAQARRCAVGITSCEARVAIRPGPFFLADLITSTFKLHFTSLHHCTEPVYAPSALTD